MGINEQTQPTCCGQPFQKLYIYGSQVQDQSNAIFTTSHVFSLTSLKEEIFTTGPARLEAALTKQRQVTRQHPSERHGQGLIQKSKKTWTLQCHCGAYAKCNIQQTFFHIQSSVLSRARLCEALRTSAEYSQTSDGTFHMHSKQRRRPVSSREISWHLGYSDISVNRYRSEEHTSELQ